MLSEFFQTMPIPLNRMVGIYDPKLVILSYLVATFASYIALDFTGRLKDPGNTSATSFLWLCGGSIAMGAGIWSMHFIGMLSFSMPMMTMEYDLYWTGLSFFVAIIASCFALFLLKTKVINIHRLAIGGIILGLGIASMHYTGMQGMKMVMNIHYLPSLFLLSILIAIAASEAALWLAIKSNQVISRIRIQLKIISAIIMGLAICGMHYVGMASAVFTPKSSINQTVSSLNPTLLSITIAGVTFIILSIAFFASAYKEALNQQQLQIARQMGMAEVASSVLHNVGNVLNSVNVTANLLAEKISHSKLDGLEHLQKLMKTHKNDLVNFMTHDAKGKQIPEFLDLLADYWQAEQLLLKTEVNSLVKNIQHIKSIVAMQQGLSKATTLNQIILIDEVLDEALLITALGTVSNIMIEKKYAKIKPIVIDKIKLLQVLVNLLSNAKDALKESTKQDKTIFLKTTINDDRLYIEITDNGIGILPKNLKFIFSYGFTSKKTGHGFGLHTSALAANEMGGALQVKSNGLEQGATFTLELPFKTPNI